LLLVVTLQGCATLKDSLILGAGTGLIVGGIAGNQGDGDRSENVLKGAVIGGVVGGLSSYLIHGSLESRDSRIRKDTILNLEKFDVMGRDTTTNPGHKSTGLGDKCYATREVDGREVLIPCRYLNDGDLTEELKQ
jgi:uncharacterized protein YcfJ